MRAIMIDLETMGTRPYSAITAIGAVVFDLHDMQLKKEFYSVVNLQSCLESQMTVDGGTVEWWMKQSDEARLVISGGGISLRDALEEFQHIFHLEPSLEVWGNGADFDNVLLACAYERAGMKVPWKFYNNRCYRTVKSFVPQIRIDRAGGTHHNALDDARAQALHLMRILEVRP